MTVNRINGSLFTSLSAVNGKAVSGIHAVNGFVIVAGPGPNSAFDFWFDGQPLVGDVDGDSFNYWSDGQPVVEEGV